MSSENAYLGSQGGMSATCRKPNFSTQILFLKKDDAWWPIDICFEYFFLFIPHAPLLL